jgi:aminoglycoside N3'-acetyltransferase
MNRIGITPDMLREGIQTAGLSRHPVFMHSSLRSFGWVEGGPDAVIDAFLAEGCTLAVPTFTYELVNAAPPDDHALRNGRDYSLLMAGSHADAVFSPDSSEISRREMGAIPATLVERPGRRRGNHPLGSFSAVGPLAALLIDGQAPDEPFAPFEALASHSGFVLCAGVGLDSMTLLRHAELLAGRNLFIRWARGPDGNVIRALRGGCSAGFPHLDGVLAPVERMTVVGSSRWRAFPVRDVLALASAAIRDDPMITHCRRPECDRCDDAVRVRSADPIRRNYSCAGQPQLTTIRPEPACPEPRRRVEGRVLHQTRVL